MKTMFKDLGLMRQLPQNHELLVRYRKTLTLTHGSGSEAAKNYVANAARVLGAVDEWLRIHSLRNDHWTDLLTAPLEAYSEFFEW